MQSINQFGHWHQCSHLTPYGRLRIGTFIDMYTMCQFTCVPRRRDGAWMWQGTHVDCHMVPYVSINVSTQFLKWCQVTAVTSEIRLTNGLHNERLFFFLNFVTFRDQRGGLLIHISTSVSYLSGFSFFFLSLNFGCFRISRCNFTPSVSKLYPFKINAHRLRNI